MKRRTIRLLPYLFLLPLVFLVIPSRWGPHLRVPVRVAAVLDWLVPAIVGLVFMTLGLLKVYGWRKGIIGGGDKTASCRLLGRCPSWSNQFNLFVMTVFLVIGAVGFGLCLVVLLKP